MTDAIVKIPQEMLTAFKEANPDVEIETVDLDSHSASIKKKYEAKGAKKAGEIEATYKSQLEDIQEQLNEALEAQETTGKKATEAEKASKELVKLQKKLEEQQSIAEQSKAEAIALKRRQSIDHVTRENGLRMAEGIDPALFDIGVQNAFASLDDDDLSDPDSIAEVVSKFKETNKALLMADSSGGAGVKTNDKTGAGKLTFEAWKSLPFAEQQARRSEILNQ